MKIKTELLSFKAHPRIMELRLALIHNLLVKEYGDEKAMSLLESMAQMFNCNWTMMVGIFQKEHKITRNTGMSDKRKKQEIIFMGYLYGETRYQISERYLNMSRNYLYQSRSNHNPDEFATDEWLTQLNDEVVVCGVRSYAVEAKRFLISFDSFIKVFTS